MTNEDLRIHELARAAQQQAIRKRQRRLASRPRPRRRAQDSKRSPTQRAGDLAEQQARRFLEAHGLIVVGCNLRGNAGEIDLIGVDRGVLVFIEVRQRHSGDYGGAAASVDRAKQQRLIKTARYFLPRLVKRHFSGMTPACRFDVITVEPAGLTWLKHAFATT